MTHGPQLSTPRRGLIGTALQVVALLLLLAILAGVVLVLFAVATLVNAPSRVVGGVGAGVSGVAAEASRAVSSAQQAVQNATDPNHPPTGLAYDDEYSALLVWHVGDELPGGSQYRLAVQAIKRRDGADSADTALYAVIHAELRQPRETRVLGQLLRSDSDPHDYVAYKGETFGIGRAVYRVNWISQEDTAIAAGVLRRPDSSTAALKFQYD
ncbi:MAG: hypothetical protein LC797_24475 [Chloroflexi bacterium]|nr:hypothetical protein [Chloroflexota bacterium]